MDEQYLKDIEERIAQCETRGPWRGGRMGGSMEAVLGPQSVQHAKAKKPTVEYAQLVTRAWAMDGDMVFIKHSRQDVPALLAEVRRLQALLAKQASA